MRARLYVYKGSTVAGALQLLLPVVPRTGAGANRSFFRAQSRCRRQWNVQGEEKLLAGAGARQHIRAKVPFSSDPRNLKNKRLTAIGKAFDRNSVHTIRMRRAIELLCAKKMKSSTLAPCEKMDVPPLQYSLNRLVIDRELAPLVRLKYYVVFFPPS